MEGIENAANVISQVDVVGSTDVGGVTGTISAGLHINLLWDAAALAAPRTST